MYAIKYTCHHNHNNDYTKNILKNKPKIRVSES